MSYEIFMISFSDNFLLAFLTDHHFLWVASHTHILWVGYVSTKRELMASFILCGTKLLLLGYEAMIYLRKI